MIPPEVDGRRSAAALEVGVGLLAALTAWRCWAGYYIDDAWISFRYAARLAAGSGLTFDDHEKVLGTSAPLWTLIVAAGDRTGLSTVDAARLAGIVGYVASVVLCALLAHHLLGGARRGQLAGILAASLLLLPIEYRFLALSGMESGLAAALGLAAILAFASRRPVLAGMLAGLAVVNKLDALMLLVALLGVAYVVERRPPLRTAATALAVIAPWVVFATWYFGSPLPQSFRAKFHSGSGVSPGWAVAGLIERHVLFLAIVAIVWVGIRWRAWNRRSRLIGGTLAVWFLGHLLAVSAVDLGHIWVWYLAVLYPPVAVLGAAAVVDMMLAASRRSGFTVNVALVVVALGFALAVTEGAGDTVVALAGRDTDGGLALIEEDLLDAGALIERYSGDDDVVESCLGTIQFATLSQPQNDFCGLSTVEAPGPSTWYVQAFFYFGSMDPPPPAGFRPVADFTSSCERVLAAMWVRVFVREGTIAAGVAPDRSGAVGPACAR